MTACECHHNKSPADDLICPITLELPWDPVMAEDGRVYERAAIEEHFSQHQGILKSPITNMVMGQRLLPSPQIKNLIGTLVENGGIAGDLASKWNENVMQQQTMEKLLKKAEGGDADAIYEIGYSYMLGVNGFKKDDMLALAWYKKAHVAGSVKGTALLGYYLCNGYGGAAKCQPTGLLYLGIAAAQEINTAAYFLGMAWADGKYGLAVNKDDAVYWLQKAVGNCRYGHLTKGFKDKVRQKLKDLKTTGSSIGDNSELSW